MHPTVHILHVTMFDGEDLTRLPYWAIWDYRKRAIHQIHLGYGLAFPDVPRITDPHNFELAFGISKSHGHEGFVFKDAESRYLPGVRSPAWLKWKFSHRALVTVTHVQYDALDSLSRKSTGVLSKKRTAGRVTRLIGTFRAKTVRFWGVDERLRERLERLTGGTGQEGVVKLPHPIMMFVRYNGIDSQGGLSNPRFDGMFKEG
jgi:ATP-dependent DNA ligase